jgi:hypothetical protein
MALPADPGLFVFLLVGLLGGAHCLGMCGPLVTLYADRMAPATDGGHARGERGPTFRQLRQHLLFNLGRTLSYAAIGALLGGVGALVYRAAAFAAVADPVRGVAGTLAGLFVLAVGLSYLGGRSPGHGSPVSFSPLSTSDLFGRLSAALTARVDRWVRGPHIVGLGAVHGFLPCPVLYPAFVYALAVGSPLRGGLSLAVLGLGTVPTLLAYGTVFGSLGTDHRRRLHRALGAAFLLLALVPLTMGLSLLGVDVPTLPIPVYQP